MKPGKFTRSGSEVVISALRFPLPSVRALGAAAPVELSGCMPPSKSAPKDAKAQTKCRKFRMSAADSVS